MGGTAADGGSRPATEEDQQVDGGTGQDSEPPEADWLDATTAGEGADAVAHGGRTSDDVEAQRDAIRNQE